MAEVDRSEGELLRSREADGSADSGTCTKLDLHCRGKAHPNRDMVRAELQRSGSG
jgi:hypothetical protein